MIEYDDFVIQISPPANGEYTVSVSQSEAGKGGLVKLPESLVATTLTSGVVGVARGTAMPAGTTPASTPPADPREVGTRLFNALFASGVLDLFNTSRGISASRGRALRVRLQLNVDDDGVRRVAALPWELLYQESRGMFLVRSADHTVVRELDVPVSGYAIPDVTGPLRVLFVMSNPRGDLQLTRERAAIERKLADDLAKGENLRQITAEFLEDATFAALEDLLRDKDYHIIHFMGHGGIDAAGEGHLLFHSSRDPAREEPRSGRDLGDLLRRERHTRLVTLNACQTASASGAAGAQPFAGVAQALVQAGVPAVVAMQVPVSDQAAIEFAARLYSAIGRGQPIEAAVDEGRSRLHALDQRSDEWATPVLFLRDVVPFPAQRPAPVAAPVRAAAAPADDPWGPADADTFRVFLAAPIMKLTSINKDVAARLQALPGVRVVTPPLPAPDADPETALREFQASVRRILAGADMAVHLLGDSPGDSLTDDALCTFPIEQLRAALEASVPVMVVMQKASVENIALEAYKSFIGSLQAHYSSEERFQQAVVEVRGMIADEVTATVQRLRAARTAAPATSDAGAPEVNAYVDVLQTEADMASQLLEVLNALDLGTVTRKKSDGKRTPGAMTSDFARVLSENQLYVVLQGAPDPSPPSPSHWASYRWRDAQKLAVTSDTFNGVVAVYRPQSSGGERFEVKLNNLPEQAPARQALKALIDKLS